MFSYELSLGLFVFTLDHFTEDNIIVFDFDNDQSAINYLLFLF